MRSGAFAMFDALGFKGIWRRNSPEQILAKLAKVQKRADETLAAYKSRLESALSNVRFHLDVRCLSDTVIVGSSVDPLGDDTVDPTWIALALLAVVVSDVLGYAASSEPGLAYRGCVAFGEFAMDKDFIVGPAVDSAAEHMDRCQGALVWLLPSARDMVRNRPAWAIQPDFLVPYRVPLKGGDYLSSYVISPLGHGMSEAEESTLVRQILSTFNADSVDVQIKREVTSRFLEDHQRTLRSARRREASSAEAAETSSA